MAQNTRKRSKRKRKQPESQLGQVLDQAIQETNGDTVALDDLVQVYGKWCYGPVLLVVSLLALFPLVGGLPFVSMVAGTLIILVAAQMPFRECPWTPGWVQRCALPRGKFVGFARQAKRCTGWLRDLVRPRWLCLTEPPWTYGIALACVFMGLLFFPLDYIPFAVAVPGAVVAVFGLGLTVRDGMLILLGFLLTAVPIGLLIWLWPFAI